MSEKFKRNKITTDESLALTEMFYGLLKFNIPAFGIAYLGYAIIPSFFIRK